MGKNMMRQMQKMQSQIMKMQENLDKVTVDTTAGGGVVSVTINGNQEIVDLRIDPEAVDPEDVEMLQDLIIAAVNEGLRKAKETVEQELSKITAGLNLPPGLL
jgi:DNA-binding YbaB/EbfC family protein